MQMCMKIRWRPLQVHSIWNNICSSNNNRHRKVQRLLNYKWRKWQHNLLFGKFRRVELQVPPNRLKFVEGFPFEFELGRRMVLEWGSYAKGFRDPTTQTSTPKSMEKVITEVMKANKVVKTMAIVSLNIRKLTLEVNILKHILAVREKGKVMLQEELDNKRDIQKGYKHNVEIWKKNKVEVKQNIKVPIKKLQDEIEELKGSTTWLKLQEEERQDLRQKDEIQETIKRKWTEALFLHKKQ